MTDKMKSDSPAWQYLETFELRTSSPTNKLYANGRQQVQLTVDVRAIDVDSKVVALTEAQRQSVCLIDYDSGEVLPHVPDAGRVTEGWGATRQRNEFAFFPGSREADAQGKSASDTERFVWYVQTTDSAPKRIGCQIRRDDSTVFMSNADNFKKLVEVAPQRTPLSTVSRAAEQSWESQRVEGDENEWDMTTVDYYYCGVSVSGSRVRLTHFTVTPASMFQWESGSTTSDAFSFTGYAAPGSDSVTYAVPKAFESRRHLNVSMPRDNEGVVVLIRQVGIRQDGGHGTNRSPCDVDATDEFGNDHRFRVAFRSSANRHELILSRR